MDVYVVCFAVVGFAFLVMAWMPAISREARVSYSIIYVLMGMVLYLVLSGLPVANPMLHQEFTVHFTELIVIISLMGTGLKIDEPFKFSNWKIPFRLVSVNMVLCIGMAAIAAHYFLKFDLALRGSPLGAKVRKAKGPWHYCYVVSVLFGSAFSAKVQR